MHVTGNGPLRSCTQRAERQACHCVVGCCGSCARNSSQARAAKRLMWRSTVAGHAEVRRCNEHRRDVADARRHHVRLLTPAQHMHLTTWQATTPGMPCAKYIWHATCQAHLACNVPSTSDLQRAKYTWHTTCIVHLASYAHLSLIKRYGEGISRVLRHLEYSRTSQVRG